MSAIPDGPGASDPSSTHPQPEHRLARWVLSTTRVPNFGKGLVAGLGLLPGADRAFQFIETVWLSGPVAIALMGVVVIALYALFRMVRSLVDLFEYRVNPINRNRERR